MKYRTIGADPQTRREVSVLALGAMLFGSVTDERTSFAVLDRYVEAGGTFIDTSDNYAFWTDGGQGGQSEELLGRWRRSRGVGDEIVVATKLGARPLAPGTSYVDNPEGLSAKVIREAADRSRERLGTERLDLLYAHIDDHTVPQRETVEGFAALVAEGTVGLLGASNQAVWRVERARALAAAAGLPGYEVLQYAHSYLRPRTDVPEDLFPDGSLGHAGAEMASYLRAEPALTLVAYSPLLKGAYTRPDRLPRDFDHPGTPARLAVLREIADETGATVNQVVLAWQLGHELPIVPLVGVSSVAQLEENLAAVDLELSAEQRARLDGAH
ncbi:aldo/keto reductase [Streptomyces griseomycini]|uniref:Aryl-alcohol dehydrogenase-like predicted oxidoreductase n=1 Tax=Streptomyces griseomycini TaxID=66895 RepID=A0A7W7PUP9_9ACTN|nr:aldo/keto reductase [Streptomyces griseomycini]MBB4901625.1 aryl-alcohol dehydrogenase-like predicted oxidoreductase [Streptomyces griseomycini]GGQ22292.1 oxidoreductase [Streptomyces griseomycini]GGR44345.1 oxidoreductase [Streptomyces griseomycini]